MNLITREGLKMYFSKMLFTVIDRIVCGVGSGGLRSWGETICSGKKYETPKLSVATIELLLYTRDLF